MKVFLFGILILFYSSILYSEEMETLCFKNVNSGELEPFGVEHRLAIAVFDKQRLDKLLNKIPKLKPDTIAWVKGELSSKDNKRILKIMGTLEYHQYLTVRWLENITTTLRLIIQTTNSIVEIEKNEFTKYEQGEWVYYATALNNYDLIYSLNKIYENNIIDKPRHWEMNLQLQLCMRKVNDLIENIVDLETYSY